MLNMLAVRPGTDSDYRERYYGHLLSWKAIERQEIKAFKVNIQTRVAAEQKRIAGVADYSDDPDMAYDDALSNVLAQVREHNPIRAAYRQRTMRMVQVPDAFEQEHEILTREWVVDLGSFWVWMTETEDLETWEIVAADWLPVDPGFRMVRRFCPGTLREHVGFSRENYNGDRGARWTLEGMIDGEKVYLFVDYTQRPDSDGHYYVDFWGSPVDGDSKLDNAVADVIAKNDIGTLTAIARGSYQNGDDDMLQGYLEALFDKIMFTLVR